MFKLKENKLQASVKRYDGSADRKKKKYKSQKGERKVNRCRIMIIDNRAKSMWTTLICFHSAGLKLTDRFCSHSATGESVRSTLRSAVVSTHSQPH